MSPGLDQLSIFLARTRDDMCHFKAVYYREDKILETAYSGNIEDIQHKIEPYFVKTGPRARVHDIPESLKIGIFFSFSAIPIIDPGVQVQHVITNIFILIKVLKSHWLMPDRYGI